MTGMYKKCSVLTIGLALSSPSVLDLVPREVRGSFDGLDERLGQEYFEVYSEMSQHRNLTMMNGGGSAGDETGKCT
jgi:hypothetical protein